MESATGVVVDQDFRPRGLYVVGTFSRKNAVTLPPTARIRVYACSRIICSQIVIAVWSPVLSVSEEHLSRYHNTPESGIYWPDAKNEEFHVLYCAPNRLSSRLEALHHLIAMKTLGSNAFAPYLDGRGNPPLTFAARVLYVSQ